MPSALTSRSVVATGSSPSPNATTYLPLCPLDAGATAPASAATRAAIAAIEPVLRMRPPRRLLEHPRARSRRLRVAEVEALRVVAPELGEPRPDRLALDAL